MKTTSTGSSPNLFSLCSLFVHFQDQVLDCQWKKAISLSVFLDSFAEKTRNKYCQNCQLEGGLLNEIDMIKPCTLAFSQYKM